MRLRDPLDKEEDVMASGASGEHALLEGLSAMVFFEQRFARPLMGALGGSEVAPYKYLSDLFAKLPTAQVEIARIARIDIVNQYEHCPSPKDVRTVIANAALKAQGFDFNLLYEKAKNFLAFPPQTQAVANEWLNKVIYSSIRSMGREQFMLSTLDAWSAAVTNVIFSDDGLCACEVHKPEIIEVAPRSFKDLLPPNS